MGVRGDMAARGSLYRTCNGESSMVYNAQIYNAPLLPFEKQLIESIGATEEEYRYLVTEALKKSRIRPAGYEHIPDIRCDPGTALGLFLINLAVGTTLLAAQYLLTPKPKQPKRQERRELESINNAGRFSPTFGFDSQAELATFGEPIPIIFGQYDEVEKVGGILASPKLVWSRMFSEGTQQKVKLAFVVGEQGGEDEGIGTPDLSGIFIGNNPLDAIYQSSFEFYWRAKSIGGSGSRLLKSDLKYGDQDSSMGEGDAVLLCPTAEGNGDRGFSAAYSLSNNTEFGCYAPIPNGSLYRVNWRHIPMIGDSNDSDPLAWERIKIAGTYSQGRETEINKGHDHAFHTDGTGRNYSRRMGILYYHRGGAGGSGITASNSEVVKIIDNVQIDDVCEFHIMPSSQKLRDYHPSVKVDDINSEIDAQRAAADDVLQVGEIFQIGKTVWQVYHRDIPIWTDANDLKQKIWLKCVDHNNGVDNKIGIVSDGVVSPPTDKGFGDGWISDSLDPDIEKEPGAGFYPLLRTSKAVIKNTRDCETTEIGIRSKVSQNLQGLCNFQSLLSPEQLHDLEDDDVQIQSGTITTSIKRASLFTVKYRDTSTVRNTSGADVADWKDFGVLFAVIGSQSVDQYNWLRIRHPERNKYEYKVTPVAGAGIKDYSNDYELYQLKALGGENNYYSISVVDNFKLEFNGIKTTKEQIKMNKEFTNRALATTSSITTSGPNAVSIESHVTGKEDWDNIARMTAAKWVTYWGGTGTGADEGSVVTGRGRGSSFTWELFGQATAASPNEIEDTFTFTTTNPTGNKPVKLKIKAIKNALPSGHWMASGGSAGESETHTWAIVGATDDTADRVNEGVVPDLNEDAANNLDWTEGNRFKIQKSCVGSNPWAQNALNGPLAYAGIEVFVTGHDYIHDVARGKLYGVPHEVFGNAESEPLNSTKTVRIVLNTTASMSGTGAGWSTNIGASPARTLTVDFKGTVKNISPNWTGRSNGWNLDSITVISSTGNWNAGENIEFFKTSITSASNPFWRTLQGRLGWNLKIDSVTETTTGGTVEIDPSQEGSRIFEGQSQYSDLSLYGSLVVKSNESSPEHTVVYINEQLSNDENIPTYDKLITSCLVLNASRNFSALDQMRVWLSDGIPVERLHPDDSSATGSSNLFTDLTYYLLTNRKGGAGQLFGDATDGANLIDKTQLATTSKFLRYNKLFFNGALFSSVNVRSYLSELAPNFLCDFILLDGKLSLKPSVPVDSSGQISLGAVEIKQLFTTGNILEDTFKVEYLDASERTAFKAVLRYREEKKNHLPLERTVTVRRSIGDDDLAIETFDLTGFCTSRDHAELVGKYFLALRHHIKHTCSFQTTPYGLDLAPGDYIRVTTESSPYNAANNGTVSASGVITSVTTLEDGAYEVLYYSTSGDNSDVEQATMQISNGKATDSKFNSSIFSVVSTTNSQNVYRVEQLTLNQENTVEIVASEFPCDSGLVSLMARDLRSSSAFTVSE